MKMTIKQQVKELKEQGKSIKEISLILKKPFSTVQYWFDEEARSKNIERSRKTYKKLTKEQKHERYLKRKDYQKNYLKKRYHEDEEFRKRFIGYVIKYNRKKKNEKK